MTIKPPTARSRGVRVPFWPGALVAMALGLALCLPALGIGLQVDDHVHRATLTDVAPFPFLSRPFYDLFSFMSGDPQENIESMNVGVMPWWSYPQLRASLFRPLAGLTHWLDYQLWPDRPALMHAHSLLWYLAAMLVAAFFFRRVCATAGVALLATFLFALDDAHGLPAAWIANRNALIAFVFGAAALLAYMRRRADGWRIGAWIAPPLLLFSVLGNEGGVAAGGYMLAYALFADQGRWSKRLTALLPCALVGLAWFIAYKLLGYGVYGSGMYVDPGREPLRFLGAVAERGPILLWGQFFFPPADLYLVLSQQARGVMWPAAVAVLAILFVLFVPVLRRDRIARFLGFGMLLSILPVCGVFPADRLLTFTGLGGMALLARFLALVFNREARRAHPIGWRVPALAFGVAFLVIHLLLAPIALSRAPSSLAMFGSFISRAAKSLPTDARIADQQVLIVNTPTAFFSVFGPVLQALDGQPVPQRTRVLGSSIRMIEITRPDVHTLTIQPEGGFLLEAGVQLPGEEPPPLLDIRYAAPLFDILFRGDQHEFAAGDRIELADVTVTVESTTPDGRPLRVRFAFDRPLEDQSYRWLRWHEGRYEPFDLPDVGETVTLPPPALMTEEEWDDLARNLQRPPSDE